MPELSEWLTDYCRKQEALTKELPISQLPAVVDLMRAARDKGGRIFVFGNGGSAANASHFATDVGKGASDVSHKRFRILSLNDNTPWMTALGNDYSYDDVFSRQLENFAEPGDVALCMSVSGNSPNLVKAMQWAKDNGLATVAMVGAKRGALAGIADHVLVIPDTHYGRVEDAHMTLCHMLAYTFMEVEPAKPKGGA